MSIESDESGKKIYSNEILRNAEARRRLQRNVEYQPLKEHLDSLEREGRNLQTEIDILERKFSVIEQMVTLVMVEGHILAHYEELKDPEGVIKAIQRC